MGILHEFNGIALHNSGDDMKFGDVVVLIAPDNILGVKKGQYIGKRVAKLPGDDFNVKVEDEKENSNAKSGRVSRSHDSSFDGWPDITIKLPKDQCYLIGDDLSNSSDSRQNGPFPTSRIFGKAQWFITTDEIDTVVHSNRP